MDLFVCDQKDTFSNSRFHLSDGKYLDTFRANMRFCSFVKYTFTLFMSIFVTFHIFQYRSIPTYIKVRTTGVRNHFHADLDLRMIMKKESLIATKSQVRTLHPGQVKPGWVILPGNVTVHVGEEPVVDNVSYIINAESYCKSLDPNRTSLVIFIASTAHDVLQRRAIRKSWALRLQQEAYNFKVVFFIGETEDWAKKPIFEENARYGDIVQMNFAESFRILGLKSLMGIRWCAEYCNNADFYMKTDDDIIVHIPNLFKALKSAKNPEDLLLCHQNNRRVILRPFEVRQMPIRYSKYAVTEDELPGTLYPPYCSGMAYIFSRKILKKLLDAANVTPVFFIEDVYITGFVRYKAGVNMTINEGISVRSHASLQEATCDFRDGRITSQQLKYSQMSLLWDEMNTQGYFCPKLLGYARQWFTSLGNIRNMSAAVPEVTVAKQNTAQR